MIYLDHNATTPIDAEVLEAMQPFLQGFYGNPSSLHKLGRLSRTAIDTAREQVASLVNCHPEQVIFTSGGSESNNFAVRGLLELSPSNKSWALGATEHASIFNLTTRLLDASSNLIPVNSEGIITENALTQLIHNRPGFASIMWANNETGTIQDIPQLSQYLAEAGIPLHTDAIQAVGKISVDFARWPIDAMSLSAHKINGPKGVGALILKDRHKHPLPPLITGGGQENGFRSGTENVPAIVGFGKAAELALSRLAEHSKHVTSLRKKLESELITLPRVHLFVKEEVSRLPGTIMLSVDGIDGETLLMQLDRASIAASSGSACDSTGREPSHVLTAMGVPRELALGALRISLGPSNTMAEIESLLNTIKNIVA